jgi:hypothetical protein
LFATPTPTRCVWRRRRRRAAFGDATSSALVCTPSFHHYPDPERAIADHPGGRIVIADMTTDRSIMRIVDRLVRRFQPSHVGCHLTRHLEQLLTAAGLTDPSTRALIHGFYANRHRNKPT